MSKSAFHGLDEFSYKRNSTWQLVNSPILFAVKKQEKKESLMYVSTD